MAAPPLEIHGKSYPMTVLTPVPRGNRELLHFILWFFAKFLSLSVVKDLMFIHFANWLPLRRDKFPRLSDEQPAEELENDYFLFTTNFNGSWDQYIDAFGLIWDVRKGLNMLWLASRGFPGAWPIRPFKRYIHYFEYPLNLYYNAYPGMSVRDIEAATRLVAELDDFTKKADGYEKPEVFQEKFRHLLNKVAAHLGDTGGEGAVHEIPSHTHSQPHGLQL